MKTLTLSDLPVTEHRRSDERAGERCRVLSRPGLPGTGIFVTSQS